MNTNDATLAADRVAEGNDLLGRLVLNDGAHSDTLQCRWRRWRVIGPRALALDMPPGNCTDMLGAIRVAKALMPDVRELHTFCDGMADTMYSCVGGQWQTVTA